MCVNPHRASVAARWSARSRLSPVPQPSVTTHALTGQTRLTIHVRIGRVIHRVLIQRAHERLRRGHRVSRPHIHKLVTGYAPFIQAQTQPVGQRRGRPPACRCRWARGSVPAIPSIVPARCRFPQHVHDLQQGHGLGFDACDYRGADASHGHGHAETHAPVASAGSIALALVACHSCGSIARSMIPESRKLPKARAQPAASWLN